MSEAKKNDKVKVHYTGKLANGEIFDSSLEREPLEFTVGAGQMIKGFDSAVDGMSISEKKTVEIPANEAYGPSNPDLIQEVPKSQLPEELKLEVGQNLVAQNPDGGQTQVVIREVNKDSITIDANHQLAGKDLTFEIELMEIG